jgi:hypothetical protein
MCALKKIGIALTLLLSLSASSCMVHKKTEQIPLVQIKTLVYEFDKGWLKYKIFQMPDTAAGAKSKKHMVLQPIMFSIRIINMQDGSSPLRRLCSNLEEYNEYYEYLLNQAKNDIVILNGNEIEYPVYYSFENSYNVFPFETINVGYSRERLKHGDHAKNLRLLYQDKIFSHDTLMCRVGASITL